MKIAVFIAGPFRYSNLVLNSIERILGDIDFEVFFHIWNQDLGNKKRIKTDSIKFKELSNHPKTKAFFLSAPYTQSDYENNVGIQTNSNSTINATMGMFLSMNILCNYLELLPDKDEFTHIFRMRTDCLIFKSFEKIIKHNKNKVLVSDQFEIPKNWISDHIMIAPKLKFYKFWKFNNMNKIYFNYKVGRRNPEKVLSLIGKFNFIKIVKCFQIGIDYLIIYNPPINDYPKTIIDAINKKGINYLFNEIHLLKNEINTNHYIRLFKKQNKIKDHLSFFNRMKIKFKIFLNR